jgi:putative acetyltransferase
VVFEIVVEDASDPDVLALVARHLEYSREVTPIGGVFALGPDALHRSGLTVFGAREDRRLVGIAALQELAGDEGELKTMHTLPESRRCGVGRALVGHVLEVASVRGYRRVNLETGNFEAFAPARALYERCGFIPCDPHGPYVGSPTSACMTIAIEPLSP